MLPSLLEFLSLLDVRGNPYRLAGFWMISYPIKSVKKKSLHVYHFARVKKGKTWPVLQVLL
jgi:hypothetical protein